MSQQRFCIDLGSTYTKVAVRVSVNAVAELISDAENLDTTGDPRAFFSAAMHDGQVYRFGREADRSATSADYRVFRNWKPRLFAALAPPKSVAPSGMAALLASDEFRRLARSYGVADPSIAFLVAAHQAAATAFGVAPPGPSSEPPPAAVGDTGDVDELAVAYFSWLRERVHKVSDYYLKGVDPATVPTRLCVPAFLGDGGVVPDDLACRLAGFLAAAGWKVDEEVPLVTEPESNVVGILTNGKSVVWRPYPNQDAEWVDLGRMFESDRLAKAYRRERPEYTVLVCDIGSYTSDLAFVRSDTRQSADVRPEVRQRSEPLGIFQLDSRVQGILPAEKSAWWGRATDRRREQCKNAIYSEGREYATPAGDIGNSLELPAIRGCLDAFGGELGRVCDEFCAANGIARCDEVVVTGGGSLIPGVRNSFLAAVAHRFGTGYVVRVPEGVPTRAASLNLTPAQVRGGSALGGCSVYFEKQYN